MKRKYADARTVQRSGRTYVKIRKGQMMSSAARMNPAGRAAGEVACQAARACWLGTAGAVSGTVHEQTGEPHARESEQAEHGVPEAGEEVGGALECEECDRGDEDHVAERVPRPVGDEVRGEEGAEREEDHHGHLKSGAVSDHALMAR